MISMLFTTLSTLLSASEQKIKILEVVCLGETALNRDWKKVKALEKIKNSSVAIEERSFLKNNLLGILFHCIFLLPNLILDFKFYDARLQAFPNISWILPPKKFKIFTSQEALSEFSTNTLKHSCSLLMLSARFVSPASRSTAKVLMSCNLILSPFVHSTQLFRKLFKGILHFDWWLCRFETHESKDSSSKLRRWSNTCLLLISLDVLAFHWLRKTPQL